MSKKIARGFAANVLALGEEADFEALNCQPALSLIRSTKLHLSTEPAFLPNACYLLGFFRSLAVCPCLLLPCCFGLVALLDFLALVCALKKYKCATKCVGLSRCHCAICAVNVQLFHCLPF
jgi:hypothetical protein